ncbi:LCI family antimicrobial peptide [Bacillus thuringiensis]|uniref:LCI family antimicrobial peptide n=1 Tax=Bacillus thuringiensis TaxID=1428 RepID=UPI0036ECF3D8
MFKKLVVGALAAGIALTGGIGAASASTESMESSKSITSQSFGYKLQDGKHYKKVFSKSGIFDNYKYEDGIHWYYKGRSVTTDYGGGWYGHYEGREG